MKRPTVRELENAFAYVGLKEEDIVYLSTQLYGIGPLADVSNREDYLVAIHDALKSVIGTFGTIVVPTFTQQVGRYGLPFILEETKSLTGIFGEYIRTHSGSMRSLHPVFSVAAVGPKASDICVDISPVAFGIDSAFDRMVRLGAKIVCMGFEYYSGHIVSLMHHVETMFAVPYYYNKIVDAKVYAGGTQIKKPFVINVKYLEMSVVFDYTKYIDALAQDDLIRSIAIGRGDIHSVDAVSMMDKGFSLLKDDLYAFLSHPPIFQPGKIPMDGPPDFGIVPGDSNWTGFLLGVDCR